MIVLHRIDEDQERFQAREISFDKSRGMFYPEDIIGTGDIWIMSGKDQNNVPTAVTVGIITGLTYMGLMG
jgi:hypothetical protein